MNNEFAHVFTNRFPEAAESVQEDGPISPSASPPLIPTGILKEPREDEKTEKTPRRKQKMENWKDKKKSKKLEKLRGC